MSILMKISEALATTGQSLKSLGKVLLKSHKSQVKVTGEDKIIIMGNGPSLHKSLADYPQAFSTLPLMAVNFAALTQEFQDLKPQFYIMADPHFFLNTQDPNVEKLRKALEGITWPMTMYLPFGSPKIANKNISIQYFNFLGAEGAKKLVHKLYRSGRAMPRPRNVLIPAIMCAIKGGFKTIYVAGADHGWMRTLDVTEDNEVISIQPHFYEEDKKEQTRVRSAYANLKLHQVVYSFYVAFKAYHDVERFAREQQVDVINITPGSMIDAFRRGKPQL